MGELRLLQLPPPFASSSSSSSSPSAILRSHAVFQKCALISRDQEQFGASRIVSDSRKLPSVSPHLHTRLQSKALLDDHRIPFSFQSHGKKNEEELNVFDRLALAWRILFPKKKKTESPAEIAKQRLRMILISDRCSVNDNAKRKIVNNIVGALADFVEIEPQDKVQLNVCADPELGTVYSVSVPVRRVRPEFQDTRDDAHWESSFPDEMYELPGLRNVHGTMESSTNESAGSSDILED